MSVVDAAALSTTAADIKRELSQAESDALLIHQPGDGERDEDREGYVDEVSLRSAALVSLTLAMVFCL